MHAEGEVELQFSRKLVRHHRPCVLVHVILLNVRSSSSQQHQAVIMEDQSCRLMGNTRLGDLENMDVNI